MRRTSLSLRDRVAYALTVFTPLPSDLAAAERDEIEAALAEHEQAFDTLLMEAGEAPTAEQLAELTTHRDAVLAARQELTRRDEDEAQRAAAAQALRESLAPVETEEAPADGGEAAPAETAEQPELITAAAPAAAPTVRPSLGAARRQAPAVPVPAPVEQGERYSLLASAGVHGFSSGDEISWLQAGEIFEQRARQMPAAGTKGRTVSHVASLRIPFPENLVAAGDSVEADQAVMDFACDESRLQGGSLTAAGTGWCAPSEIFYDLPSDGASLDGLYSTPEINPRRGGIKWTYGADFASVYGNGFLQTEAQNIASASKAVVSVTCPPAFQEKRLDSLGLYIKAGILQNQGYPESIANFLGQSQIAYRHYFSARKISLVVAGSTAVTAAADALGATSAILRALAVQIEDMKYKRRLARSESLEVILPFWAQTVIRDDVTRRTGWTPDVADAQIAAWFAQRQAAVQYVYDWQDKITGTSGGPGDPAANATALPTTVQALIYRAGTWLAGVNDVITMSAIYDSTLLTTNEYVALFMEQGLFMARRGYESRVVTIPFVPNGYDALTNETAINA